ncbi:hypothetical protein T440DRAFT_1897 [Plenodomus tracheiphilus IPT5]|uniref:Vacuolar ATPase assembly protein VMA22 n=1 Tax=Plenodomus tracheiphilus IPT5 TaxID=1408161 RepID=A0A6A7BM36_9PLEO|nr:hypothetical protein T440DRAFT_1897 [Plenodomus tracheiphilus IPT5]
MTEVLSQKSGITEASDDSRKNDLIEELDGLLERYLYTLDEYQKLREELSKQLSSGYMSLAQANFHNSSSAIRYGKDCYDDRMQANRTVHMSEILDDNSPSGRSHFTIRKQNEVKPSDPSDVESLSEKKSAEKTTSSDSPDRSAADDEKSRHEREQEEEKASNSSMKSPDPLRWFGILVPPALRTAQSTFITAVEGPIARLATVAMDMRSQEIEIGRMRKQIKKLS